MGVHDRQRRALHAVITVYHCNRVRCSVGLGSVSLYLAIRHYFGWYALHVLELP